MYISKRSFVRIISFLVAIIVAVGIAAALNMDSSQRYKRSFEQNLTRNVEDLSNEIENIKIPLEAFVNKQLSRTDIKVEAYIDEETLNSNKAYTKEEKFVELMNKNPYVKEFQKLFDLYL